MLIDMVADGTSKGFFHRTLFVHMSPRVTIANIMSSWIKNLFGIDRNHSETVFRQMRFSEVIWKFRVLRDFNGVEASDGIQMLWELEYEKGSFSPSVITPTNKNNICHTQRLGLALISQINIFAFRRPNGISALLIRSFWVHAMFYFRYNSP